MSIVMDTHLHSKQSDGFWTPSEVVEQAKARGLEVIAITDHSTIDGIEEAMEKGKEVGVRVITGIEMSPEYKREDGFKISGIDLLGLDFDIKKMASFVDELQELRRVNLQGYVDAFNNYISSNDFEKRNKKQQFQLQNVREVTLDEVVYAKQERMNYFNKRPMMTKYDLMQYMIDNFMVPVEGIVPGEPVNRVMSTKIKEESPFIFELGGDRVTFPRAIEMVKESNGIAILAHPGKSDGYKHGFVKEWEEETYNWFSKTTRDCTPYKFVKKLVNFGLDGVEVYNYEGMDKKHAEMHNRINGYFKCMASENGLLTTYGSDCHGPKGEGVQIGLFGSEKIYL